MSFTIQPTGPLELTRFGWPWYLQTYTFMHDVPRKSGTIDVEFFLFKISLN